ncbi:MAG: ATP-binding protein [Candidatus Acidiferrales bacterium]
MNLLFYARLIGLTAGTLVYLFLLALILGHRRPRMLERLLFFLLFALFLIYAGALLEMNALIQYVSPPNATRFFYDGLQALGAFLLLPLVWHTHYAYGRQVRKSPTGVFSRAFVVMFYLIALLGLGMGLSLLWGGATDSGRLLTLHYFLQGGRSLLPVIALLDAVLELRDWRKATDSVERRMFQCLFVVSGLLAVLLVLLRIFGAVSASRTDVILTATISAGILPGVVLVYFFLRHNFLEYGAQRNLVYALSATFLALLYLALVRRVGTWLEPVLPPEATASFLLFVLIFLFEPLERVIGPILHRGMRERMGRVQRLSVELQQESRHGSVRHLIAEAEKRVREEFGLAAVRLSVPRDPGLTALESPGGLGHVAQIRLMKDGEEVGLLEAASTGSYLTGETTAALEFLAEQLPGMLDLARLIEEKLGLERELAERERMASLGQMAANVSHNLRNPLSSMKTVLQVQLENPDLPVNVRRDCSLVVNEIDRMNAKLSQLLRYAKPSANGQRVAAVALANQTAVLFRHDAEQRNVRLEFERPTSEIFALASEDGLSEVLSNLIVNALEAQPEGGRVRVSLSRYEGRLEIIVDDDGPGISAELRGKIFQPYFTTKATGTGLGLSIVARRIDEMGGTMACESPLRGGKGTRFRLTLPLADPDREGK